jgi:hypothetical protein
MNELTKAPVVMGFGDMERLAVSIAKSGLFGMKTPEQALVLMAISQAEGRHPALAARDYDVISGRPAKKAEAMLRDFLEAGGKTQWHALSDEIADATFSHPSGGSVRIMWNMERAAKAGLGGKDNWKKFPRQMLRSRTVSEGVRTVWPMATSGMHVPEETVDFTGTTLDAEPEAPPLRAAAAATPRAPRVTEKAERTDDQWRVWLTKLRDSCATLYRRDEVVEIAGKTTVADAAATGPAWVQREIASILAENYARFGSDDGDAASEDLDDVHIVGEEKLASGD